MNPRVVKKMAVPEELGECWDPLEGVRDTGGGWGSGGPLPAPELPLGAPLVMVCPGGLPPWLRGDEGTGRIVSATEMSDCIGEGAPPGLVTPEAEDTLTNVGGVPVPPFGPIIEPFCDPPGGGSGTTCTGMDPPEECGPCPASG